MSFPIPSVPGRVALLTDRTAAYRPGDLPRADDVPGRAGPADRRLGPRARRDTDSSRALRAVDTDRARALLDAHLAGGRDGALRALDAHLPGVEDARIRAGAVRAVAEAAELLRRREALAARVRADRAASAEAP